MSGTFMAPLQQVMPQMGGLNPMAFLQLTTRHGLEAIDLRYEALDLAALALAVEEQGIDGLEVVRPVPGLTDERVLVTSSVDGVALTRPHARPDPELALRALTALTLEPALVHGLFWADPAPEHLVVTRGGGLALVGVGAAGHLSPTLRKAGIRFLTSVVSGDAEGQVEAMQLAGAVPPGTDLDALVDDLRSADTLQVSHILMGGETGLLSGLRDATRILLTHRLQPPLEVVMLLRTVFALGELVDRVAPDSGGLMAALLPLLQQLPDLIAAAQIDE
jgi:predicted unusual protein kinase regulating ubiquinone biosynthesis (AarF/ABC1/UbiB family)